MPFIQCVNPYCGVRIPIPSDFFSGFEDVVLNGITDIPQKEIQCHICRHANFITPNLRVVGIKD